MRKSLITLFLLFFLISIISYKTIFKIYFDYKLSKWVEKDVIIGDFNFKFPKTIVIKNLKIQNSNSTYYENIFSSDYIKFVEHGVEIKRLPAVGEKAYREAASTYFGINL